MRGILSLPILTHPVETRNTTRICIVRHGETDWNIEKRIQGHIDVPLNVTGEAQARATAAGLTEWRFDAAYSSDLARAWRTAEIAVAERGLAVRSASGLRERHYGMLQGLTTDEIRIRHPADYGRYLARDPDYGFATGESLAAFAARVVSAIEALALAHRGQHLLLVSHGGVLDVCYRQATGRGLAPPRDFPIPNAALNWFEVGASGWRLLEWADRRHLARALEDSPE